jgi:hypothetical protein
MLARSCCIAGGQRSATAPATSAHVTPVVARRLTMAQARAAYLRITRPFNAAVAAVNRDVASGAPWSRLRADTLAVVRADRAWAGHMRAERWPARVQRYATAMLRTDIPAEIRCDQAMAAAGGMQAATTGMPPLVRKAEGPRARGTWSTSGDCPGAAGRRLWSWCR